MDLEAGRSRMRYLSPYDHVHHLELSTPCYSEFALDPDTIWVSRSDGTYNREKVSGSTDMNPRSKTSKE